MVAEYGINYFVGEPNITIVDRENLQNVIDEFEFGNMDMIDQSTALKVGKMVSASYLITGKITQKQHRRTISAKIIEIETGKIIGASYQIELMF